MTAEELRPERLRRRTAAAAVAVSVVALLPAFLTGALAVQITEDLGLDLAAIGLLVGLYFGASAIGSAPLGRMTESVGWPRVLRASSLVIGSVLVAIALLAHQPWAIGVFLVVGGLAAAASQSSTNLALARSIPAHRHGLIFGLRHVAAPVATLLGGLAVPGFALTVGWRWAFIAAAAVAVLASVAVPGEDGHGPARASPPARLAVPAARLVALAAAAALGTAGSDAAATFLVAHSVDVGIDPGAAGFLLAVASIGAMSVRLSAGWLVDRLPTAGLPAIVGLLLVGMAGVATMAVAGRSWLIVGALLAFMGGWGWKGLLTFSVVRANPQAPAAATGITNTGTFVGAALGPPAFALVAQQATFATAWWSAAAALGVAAVIVAWVYWAGSDRGE